MDRVVAALWSFRSAVWLTFTFSVLLDVILPWNIPQWSGEAPLLTEILAITPVEQYRILHIVAAHACSQKGHRETKLTLNDLPWADMVKKVFSRADSPRGVLLDGCMLRGVLERKMWQRSRA